MDFEWHERKSLTNEQRHGIDFTEASKLFDGRPVVISASPRHGEARWMATGEYGEKIWSVVFTLRHINIKNYIGRGGQEE